MLALVDVSKQRLLIFVIYESFTLIIDSLFFNKLIVVNEYAIKWNEMSCFVYQVVNSEGYLYYKKGEVSCFVLKIAASHGLLF